MSLSKILARLICIFEGKTIFCYSIRMLIIQLLFENPLLYLMWAIAILFSFSVHEYAHAQAAYSLGDPTAKHYGRLSINPLAHFDPIGTLLIFIFGFGWGKPVPFNLYNLKNPRRDSAIIGFAGPLSNFLLALLSGLMIRFFLLPKALYLFLGIFCWLNLILGIFNLIPVPPLDGSHILLAFLPSSYQNLRLFLFQNSPILLILGILFMWGIGFPKIAPFLFHLITNTYLF